MKKVKVIIAIICSLFLVVGILFSSYEENEEPEDLTNDLRLELPMSLMADLSSGEMSKEIEREKIPFEFVWVGESGPDVVSNKATVIELKMLPQVEVSFITHGIECDGDQKNLEFSILNSIAEGEFDNKVFHGKDVFSMEVEDTEKNVAMNWSGSIISNQKIEMELISYRHGDTLEIARLGEIKDLQVGELTILKMEGFDADFEEMESLDVKI